MLQIQDDDDGGDVEISYDGNEDHEKDGVYFSRYPDISKMCFSAANTPLQVCLLNSKNRLGQP